MYFTIRTIVYFFSFFLNSKINEMIRGVNENESPRIINGMHTERKKIVVTSIKYNSKI